MKQRIREILIGGLFVLLSSPITIFIGYQLNNYLARDKITIEHVDLLAETKKMPFLEKEFRQLLESDSFDRYLWLSVGYGSGTVFRVRRDLDKEEVKSACGTLEGFLVYAADREPRLKKYVERLENYNAGDNIDDLVVWTGPDVCYYITRFAQNPQQTIIELRETFRLEILGLGLTKKLVNVILLMLRSFQPKRTGGLQIKLGLLNSGNTDGLIRQDGILELVNEQKWIPITEVGDIGQLPKVEKRSMAQMTFKMNEAKASQDDIKLIKNLLLHNISSPIVVEVYDIRNRPIRAKGYTLPISPPQ